MKSHKQTCVEVFSGSFAKRNESAIAEASMVADPLGIGRQRWYHALCAASPWRRFDSL
jgi:hypothetical protein